MIFLETISNVFYVPDLKSNLLSAGQFQEKGCIIMIQKGFCDIYYPSRGAIVVVQMISNKLFPLKIESVQLCLMAEVKLRPLALAFSLWPLEFWWIKNSPTGKYGNKSSSNCYSFSN